MCPGTWVRNWLRPLFITTPLVYGHHLEGDKDEEEEERAVVRALQGELDTQQNRHEDTGIETRVVMRVAHGEYICNADHGSRNADYPGRIGPTKKSTINPSLKGREKHFNKI